MSLTLICSLIGTAFIGIYILSYSLCKPKITGAKDFKEVESANQFYQSLGDICLALAAISFVVAARVFLGNLFGILFVFLGNLFVFIAYILYVILMFVFDNFFIYFYG